MVTISILKKPLPCWYEFGSKGDKGIVLKIKKDYLENFLKEIKTFPEEWRIVKYLREQLLGNEIVRKKFNIGEKENMGFGGVFLYQGEEEEFRKWLIPYPEIVKFTNEECSFCKGLGTKNDERCFWCRGTGREIEIEMEKVLAISASLMVVTLILNTDVNISRKEKLLYPQPLIVLTSLSSSLYTEGAPLQGEIGDELAMFLKNHPKPQVVEERIKETMKRAYFKMMKPLEMNSKIFKAEVKEGKVSFIFGDGEKYCGIMPSQLFSFSEKIQGYKFTSRNVQSAIQQLILLSSLAELTTLFHQAS